MDKQPEIICSCGASNLPTSKFCSTCGELLNPSINIKEVPPAKEEPQSKPLIIAPEDKHLKLLVDVYSGVTGLPNGMGRYDELVLYKDEEKESYEIHSYGGGSNSTSYHSGYEVDTEYALQILKVIKKDNILSLKDSSELPICGASLVLKIADDDGKLIRLCAGEGAIRDAHNKLGSMLREGMRSENKIVPEYAKNWKSVYISSKGMSSQDNYKFTLERLSDGTIRFCRESSPVEPMAGMMSMMNFQSNITPEKKWITLAKEDSEAINNLNLGLMNSYIEPRQFPTPMGGGIGFMSGMRDANEKHLFVTYSDDRKDEKIIDSELVSRLITIVDKYLK